VRLDATRVGRDASRIADEVIAHLSGQLGADVTVIYRGENILRGFDDDVRLHVRKEMEKAGITVLTGCVVTKVDKHGEAFTTHLSNGSSIASDNHFDQIAYFPAQSKHLLAGPTGIFDYDGAIFPSLWNNGANTKNFNAYLRYYISDHRPMWVQLKPEAQ
jgi:hypothetical protein